MKLEELFEAKKKKPLKKVASSVYHRDYEKTKHKDYRQYDPEKYQMNKE